MVIKLLRCQRIFNSVNYCQYLVHRVWDINVRKTAVRLFSIRKYLAAVLFSQYFVLHGFTFLGCRLSTPTCLVRWLSFRKPIWPHPNFAWRNAFRISLCWGPCLRLALLPQESRHKYCVLTCNFTFKCFKIRHFRII